MDLLGLARPAHFAGGQLQLPAADLGGGVGTLQEVLAALEIAMQRLCLVDLPQQRTALLQHLGRDPAKMDHQLTLRR
ncbi:hypothetical protein D3C81_829610 [compost metagenome]